MKTTHTDKFRKGEEDTMKRLHGLEDSTTTK